jgi:hypothetical protein
MIYLRVYEAGDLQKIDSRKYEQEMIRLTGRDFSEEFATAGPAFTLCDDGRPIAAGGVFVMWPGVGEAWMHLSLAATEDHPFSLYRETLAMLNGIIIEEKLRRVQAPILASSKKNREFVQHLGFIPEGLMHRWGPDDKDYIMYARYALPGEEICQQRLCS